MQFLVSIYNPADAKPKVIKPKPKWEEQGISVAKYMWHPDCIFCGLKDAGKEALERPDEKHQQGCLHRKLTHKPFTETNGVRTQRSGFCIGEGAPTSIRYPIRIVRVIQVPKLDVNGNPTGEMEPRFFCSYKWKMWATHDWVWNGAAWVPWYTWSRKPEPTKQLT